MSFFGNRLGFGGGWEWIIIIVVVLCLCNNNEGLECSERRDR